MLLAAMGSARVDRPASRARNETLTFVPDGFVETHAPRPRLSCWHRQRRLVGLARRISTSECSDRRAMNQPVATGPQAVRKRSGVEWTPLGSAPSQRDLGIIERASRWTCRIDALAEQV